MTVEEKILTYGDLENIPEGFEVIRGRLKELAPAGGEHGFFEAEVAFELKKAELKGFVLVGEVGLVISKNPLTVRAADIVFISKEKCPSVPRGMLEVPPDLVVEIISPSNTFEEIEDKVADYMDFGVGRIVLIDPHLRKVTLIDENRKISIRSFEEEVEFLPGFKLKLSEILGGKK